MGLRSSRTAMACKGSGVQIPSAPPGTTHRHVAHSGPSVSGFPVLHAESVAITIDVFEHVRLDGS
jgi:hypothetical protein